MDDNNSIEAIDKTNLTKQNKISTKRNNWN